MNMSQSKELQYFVFHYSGIFYIKKKKRYKMTIHLPIMAPSKENPGYATDPVSHSMC